MAANSKIEWTDHTWNPLRAKRLDGTGKIGWHCERVSPACAFCYAAQQNKTGWAGGTGLDYVRSAREQAVVYLDRSTLESPLHWRKPRMIFVCSMTDLFGEWVDYGWLDEIFAVMALAKQHTFQVLTKRPEIMRDYFAHTHRGALVDARVWDRHPDVQRAREEKREYYRQFPYTPWPLPNVWLGVTAENQEWADKRIPSLLATPAAVRFLSCEPLLGPIRLPDEWIWRIDQIIAGGESGPHARPSHPNDARSLRDQCQSWGKAFFWKQWGEWMPVFHGIDPNKGDPKCRIRAFHHFSDGQSSWKVGKKAAGRLLDGVEWSEFPQSPEVAHA